MVHIKTGGSKRSVVHKNQRPWAYLVATLRKIVTYAWLKRFFYECTLVIFICLCVYVYLMHG
jgi:hypothetical protein